MGTPILTHCQGKVIHMLPKQGWPAQVPTVSWKSHLEIDGEVDWHLNPFLLLLLTGIQYIGDPHIWEVSLSIESKACGLIGDSSRSTDNVSRRIG